MWRWRDVTMKQLRPKHMCFVWRKQLYHCRVCAQHLWNGERWLLISSCRKHMCFLWWREIIKRRRSPQHACRLFVVENRRWYEQCRRLISSGPNTIGILWRRELIKRRHSPQHCPLVESKQRSACCCWKSTVIWTVTALKPVSAHRHRISIEH
jgi:hypothetical protein